MKAFGIYLVLGLSTIVAQTTVLRLPLFHEAISDLLIPLVVFLSLDQSDRQGMAVVFVLGLVMDLISGATFGIYLSIYFWVFLSARGLSKYFDVGKTVFQAIVIGLYVLGQHIVLAASVSSTGRWAELFASQALPIALQTTFGAISGPWILMLLRRLDTRFVRGPAITSRETEELGSQ